MSCLFSIILPTTGDRGELIPYSGGSVLSQTLTDLELIIIGDGLTTHSKRIIEEWGKNDQRVRFFPFPKGPRRGEIYRDAIIRRKAKGQYISYLCDRDLYLSHHLEIATQWLSRFNFVAASCYYPQVNGTITNHELFEMRPGRIHFPAMNLSAVTHTRELYMKLDHGWETTPDEEPYTDAFMWKKFLKWKNGLKGYYFPQQTFLWMKRGDHPGWSTQERLPEIKKFYEMIESDLINDYIDQHLEDNQDKTPKFHWLKRLDHIYQRFKY